MIKRLALMILFPLAIFCQYGDYGSTRKSQVVAVEYNPKNIFSLYVNPMDQDGNFQQVGKLVNFADTSKSGTLTGYTAPFLTEYTDSGLTLTAASTQYVTFGNNFDVTTGDFTLFAIVKQTSIAISRHWIGKRTSTGNYYRLYMNTAGNIVGETNSGSTYKAVTASGNNSGSYVMAMLVRSGGTLYLYRNNISVGTPIEQTLTLTNAADFEIGKIISTGYLEGIFAAGGFVGSALSNAQRTQLYSYFKSNYPLLSLP